MSKAVILKNKRHIRQPGVVCDEPSVKRGSDRINIVYAANLSFLNNLTSIENVGFV